jgi:Flp pilus assembly protein TadG
MYIYIYIYKVWFKVHFDPMMRINQTTIIYCNNISPKGCKLASQVEMYAFSALDRLYHYWTTFDTNFNDCINRNALFTCLLVCIALKVIPH